MAFLFLNKIKILLFTFFLLFSCFLACGCADRSQEFSLETMDGPGQNMNESEKDMNEPDKDAGKGEASTSNTDSVEELPKIYVYICGQVISPGVYELSEGARVYEAVNRAGGFTGFASCEYVNQAEPLNDGDMVYIPSKEEVEIGSAPHLDAGNGGGSKDGLVNINTADATTLQSISGIGAKRAEDIVNYRNENGHFKSIEDIMNVPGIKDGLFSKIRDKITV